MKRSEAIEKIYQKLWVYGVPDLSKRDAESILKFFEEELQMAHGLEDSWEEE